MRRVARSTAWAALVIAALAAGCSRQPALERPPAEQCVPAPSAAPVVDPALFAFLSKASASHHKADLAEHDKDTKGAIATLDELAAGPRPGGTPPPPEVAEVLADTRARLADLRSREGAIDAALGDVDAGLALATRPTHFRGRLFEVKGVVLERRMEALRAGGDVKGAERAKTEAIQAFDQAIEIQNEVIADALKDGGAPR